MRVQGDGAEENGESLELGCTIGGLRSMIRAGDVMHVIDMRRWEGDPRSMRHDERRCIHTRARVA